MATLFGLQFTKEKWNEKDKLPMYISAMYEIYYGKIEEIECLFLEIQDFIPKINQLKNIIKKMQEIKNVPVILLDSDLSNFRKESYLKNRIPFIQENKQIYLPFMATYLLHSTPRKKENITHFTISAQLLFLWILYSNTKQYYISEAVKVLPFSNMSITRAYRQLIDCGLFKENKDGRNIYLSTSFSKKQLFDSAKEFLVSPILKQGYIFKENISKHMIVSGETALSEDSMLNTPILQEFAISKEKAKNIVLQDELIDETKQVKVEIWKYDPLIFAKENKIDPISLSLSIMDDCDERCQIAIEAMLSPLWEEKI